MNPLFLVDFYKVGHVIQYDQKTKQVWSNWTARSSRTGRDSVVFFGLQYFIKKYLIEQFNRHFFTEPLSKVIAEYKQIISATLRVAEPKTDHIEYLWRLGYLPLDIYALPEGDSVPIKVPSIVITNTDDNCFWLPNYIETILSAILWKPSTSATTAQEYRKLFVKHALRAGETDLGFVDWMGHDFSFRGMSGVEDAVLSGMGHLTAFNGTDTLPAIIAAHDYYGADYSCGGSVPATEHSVMCAGSQEGEFETFKRLITETYPSGIVSIVSDTWDLWKVLTDYIPRLAPEIHKRDGKVVIRPDSGDPVNIICGDKDALAGSPARAGTMRLLAKAMGTSYKAIPVRGPNWWDIGKTGPGMVIKAGAIYGDAITLERADQILSRLYDEQGLSPYNMVFGIGSYTYEYVTRDTYGHAMKATAVRQDGEVIPIFKKPVTDNGLKTSLKGIPVVYKCRVGQGENVGQYYVEDGQTPEALDACAFRKVFSGRFGGLLIDEKFDTIRKRVR
jgi:nicotinamide phosphoribosyltransferase